MSVLQTSLIPATPPSIPRDRHLRIAIDDILHPSEGLRHATSGHVKRLIKFAEAWDRTQPVVVHCWAGISRSTAAAFILLCALNPATPEHLIAQHLRSLSATASPNRLLVSLADGALTRDGRMIKAIDDMGRGEPAMEALPFVLRGTIEVVQRRIPAASKAA